MNSNQRSFAEKDALICQMFCCLAPRCFFCERYSTRYGKIKMQKTRLKHQLSLLILLLSGTTVFGQEEQKIEQETVKAESVEVAPVPEASLEEYSVTAYRFGVANLDVPANSTIIDRARIENSTASNVAELLQQEANIINRSTQGSSALSELAMRGFGENSQQRVLVIVDGQRFNRSDMGALNWQQIAVANIESVEVLRGSHSAIYGNNAVAGVIKITTKKVAKENTASGSVTVGNYGMYKLNGNFSVRYEDYFLTGNVNRFYEDGYRDNSRNWTNSYNLSLGKDFSESTRLVLTGNYADSKFQLPGGLSWAQFNDNPRQSVNPDDFVDMKTTLSTATFTTSSDFGEGEIGIGANTRNMKNHMTSWFSYSKNDQWAITVTPRYKFNISDDAHVIVGFDGLYDNVEYRGFTSGSFSSVSSTGDLYRTSFAPYIAGDITPIENLTLTAAFRYEAAKTSANYIDSMNAYNEDVWQDGFAANFGVNYKLDKNSSVFFRFDQLYRYPNLDEIASYQGYLMPIPFNKDLDPEVGQNYEIGYKYMDENWTAVANLFVQYLKNEIAYDGMVTFMNMNLDETLRYGFDAELRYDDDFWGASMYASIVKSEFLNGINKGKEVPLVPMFHGVVAAYVKPLEWVTFTVRGNFFDEQFSGSDFGNEFKKIPAYATLDFQADIRFCRYGSVFFAIENALDKKYVGMAFASAWGDTVHPGIGRTLKAGLRFQF